MAIAGGGNFGGGILSTGALTLSYVEIIGNTAGALGGGISAQGGVAITGSSIRGNTSGGDGGGLFALGTVRVESSEISSNTAEGDGGGINCECDELIVQFVSLVDNESNTGQGGAIFGFPASAFLANVTMSGNLAGNGGGAVSMLPDTDVQIRNATITGSDSGAGLGAVLLGAPATAHLITNSILFGNVGEDCSGFTYQTEGTDSIVGTGGCIPAGGGDRLAVDPQLQPVNTYDGGATVLVGTGVRLLPIVPILGDSPAIDAGTACELTDVRGLPRVGPACDLGAFELTLQARDFRDDGDGTLGPPNPVLIYGAARLPIDQIPGSALTDPAGNGSLDRPAAVPQAQIRGIDLEQTGLAAIPLRQVALAALPLDTEILDSIALDQLPLDYTSTTTNGDGWTAYLLDHGLTELAEQPLNTVTLGQVLAETEGEGIELSQIDFSATPLGSLPVGAIAMGTVPLSELELPPGTDWCTLIAEYSDTSCGTGGVDLDTATLVSISLEGVPLRQVPLRQVPLRQVDLTGAPLRQVPLRQVDISASPLRQVPLRQVDFVASPLRQVPLRQVNIQGSPLRQVPLRQVDFAASPLRQVPLRQVNIQGSPLRQVPLRQVANLSAIVDCGAVDCASQSLTLGDVPIDALIGTLGALVGSVPSETDLGTLGELGGPDHPDAYGAADAASLATLGELAAFFGDTTLGEIGGHGYENAYGDTTIDDFLALLIQLFPDTTLGDLLGGILPASEMPWQDLDLEGGAVALKQAVGGTADNDAYVLYDVTIDNTLPVASGVQVDLTVPDGYTLLPDSFQLKPTYTTSIDFTEPFAFPSPNIGPDDHAGRTLASMVITPPQGSFRLVFRAIPPLDLGTTGPFAIDLRPQSDFWELDNELTGIDVTIADILEDNDVVERATNFVVRGDDDLLNDVDDVLFLTHLATATDVDWFRIPEVEQGEQLSVYLANLPADYDVLLYGPARAPLRGTPSRVLPPSPDGGLSLLGDENATNALVAADIDTAAPSNDWELYAVSSRRGTTNERIDTGALPAGDYAVKVVGYNGASSASPYSLRARTKPAAGAGACDAIPAAAPTTLTLPSAATTVTDETTTILLTHLGRLQRSYPAGAGTVRDALVEFATETSDAPAEFADTSAAVVTLDDLSSFGAWDAAPCDPDAANAVVSQVGARIDAIRLAHPNVTNVVIVGADDQVPFARVKDAVPAHNESEYASAFDGASPLKAALSLGYVLTDNPYGVSSPMAIGPRELFVPEIGVGRLVESPDDIDKALGTFLDFHGELAPETALSTGYDFLTDGAEAVASELRGGLFEASVDGLINDGWSRDELRDAWIGTDEGTPADVVSVNAHFDHYRALPADQDAAGKLTAPFELDDVTRPLDGSIVFSMGCHMGLSVSDISVAGSVDEDWAQTLSGAGAIVAGNTGYGYGDDKVVGATEELMRQFARRLDGTMTVGQSMAFAKQQYITDLLISTISPFDEKVVSQVVFYGLPMYRIGDVEPPAPPVVPPTQLDPATGLDILPTTIATPIAEGGLEPKGDDVEGVYYHVNNEIQATAYQPVQPRTSRDVTQPGRIARGALITDLTSTDVDMPNPVIMTPTDDVTGTNPEARVDGAFFPSALQSVGRRLDVNGPRDQLVIVPGQFRDLDSSSNGAGIQRLFTETSAVVYYAPDGNTDVTPPTITSTSAAIVGGAAAFSVQASDDSSVARVNVIYTTDVDGGAWSSVDLPLVGGVYTGGENVTGGATQVDFFVQVVDSGGNVSVSSDKGANFAATVELTPPPPPSAPVISLPPTSTPGQYDGDVTVTVTPGTAGGPVNTTVNGGDPTTATSIVVTGSDVYTVVSTGPDGVSSTVRFFIGTIAAPPAPPTTSAATATPAPPSGWFTMSPVDVTVTGTPGSSAVESVKHRVGSSGPFTTVSGTTATVPVATEGISTVQYAATDTEGLESTVGSLEVRLDSIAPEIAVTTPAASATYGIGQAVNAAYACTDATSGVTGCSGSVAAGQPIDTATVGTKSFTVTSTDVAGNTRQSTVSYTVAPVFAPVPAGSFSVNPQGRLTFGPSTALLGSFAWAPGVSGTRGTVSGPLTFTTTGTSLGRGFGVVIGDIRDNGSLQNGHTIQFDPGYDCGTKSAGSRIGSLVIQRWIAVPLAGAPLGCTAAPVDLYPGSNNAQRTAAAKADRNARYWSKPMTIEVTLRPGVLNGTTRITATATSAGPNGQPRTISVSAVVLTSNVGPSWGVRAFGDVAGTFTPTLTVS